MSVKPVSAKPIKPSVGGGVKKLRYTLQTLKKIGFKKSAKALTANNTCKACGLGMGGQLGGMTNELDEFPSVCNKSVQAQLTDIQAAIPDALFDHSIDDLRQLSAKELEHAGRLASPIFKAKHSRHYQKVSWQWALDYAAKQFAQTDPDRSFFYSSGRSSNESGFVLQLLARLYGTNNINNCSYYCHQATSVGLGSTIGTGTATIELEDLSGCDLIFVMGANPASNHPRFIHQLKQCRDRGGHVIVINPAKEPGLVKFAVPKSARSLIAGGTDIATLYLQPRIGSDIALIKGLAKAVLASHAEDRDFIQQYSEHFEKFEKDVLAQTWQDIEQQCGLNRQSITQAAELYGQANNVVFAWGMGMTHHQHGSENVEYIANLAMLRGMLGQVHRGLLPLRGHSNVQGIGTIGVKPVLTAEVIERLQTTLNVSLPTTAGLDTYHALQAAYKGEMDAACFVGGNLYSASPHTNWAAQALNQIKFKCYLTTTLNQGHLYGIDSSDSLVLPVFARDEEQQSTTQESMFNYVRLSDGGIQRHQGTRSEVWILAQLAERLIDPDQFDFKTFYQHDSIRAAIAATVTGMEALKDIGIAKQEFHIKGRLLHRPRFNTPTGKAQFVTHRGLGTVSTCSEYPFMLATVRSEGQFNSIIYEETDSYRHDASRDTVLINVLDMRRLGLAVGDRVNVTSAQGVLQNVAVQVFDVPEGNVLAYYPEANVLTAGKLDPRSKTPNFKSVPINITRNK